MSGSRSRLDMQPCKIKKLLFMLVVHGLLKLHCGDDHNDVVFQVAKSSHDETVLFPNDVRCLGPYEEEDSSMTSVNCFALI